MITQNQRIDDNNKRQPKVGGKVSSKKNRDKLWNHTCWRLHSPSRCSYCWWTNSCTTKDDDYPITNRVLTIPGGAGFRPSTVSHVSRMSTQAWSMGLNRYLAEVSGEAVKFRLLPDPASNGSFSFTAFVTRVFPKIGVTPKSSILIGISITV